MGKPLSSNASSNLIVLKSAISISDWFLNSHDHCKILMSIIIFYIYWPIIEACWQKLSSTEKFLKSMWGKLNNCYVDSVIAYLNVCLNLNTGTEMEPGWSRGWMWNCRFWYFNVDFVSQSLKVRFLDISVDKKPIFPLGGVYWEEKFYNVCVVQHSCGSRCVFLWLTHILVCIGFEKASLTACPITDRYTAVE